MSASIEVFIDTNISLEKLVKELTETLNLSFKFQKDEFEEWFSFSDTCGFFTVGTNDYQNDLDISFEHYKYVITFWVSRDNSPEKRELLQKKVGRMLFDKIKETKKYPLMLIFDTQEKLDEFRPND